MNRGAPPKAPERRKSERLSVALTAEEHDRVCRVALAMRMDVSEFVRVMCIPGYTPEIFRSEINE